MEQKTNILYPSATLEKGIDLEQRLENKLIDVNSFNNSNNNNKEMFRYFKEKKMTNPKIKIKSLIHYLQNLSHSIHLLFCHNTDFDYLESYRNRFVSDTDINCNSMRLSIDNKVIYEYIIKSTINTKNNMKKIDKLLKLLINCTENLYNIM